MQAIADVTQKKLYCSAGTANCGRFALRKVARKTLMNRKVPDMAFAEESYGVSSIDPEEPLARPVLFLRPRALTAQKIISKLIAAARQIARASTLAVD